MKCNMSVLDRILRIVLAAAVLVLILLKQLGDVAAIVIGVLALIFFLTAVTGFCPVYAVLSTGTKKACEAEPKNPEGV